MKLTPDSTRSVPVYPSITAIRGLLVGTTLTAALAVSGCAKKDNEAKTPPSNAPAEGDKKPVLMGKVRPVNPPPTDTDGDGVTDDKDKCPREKGDGPDGCPPKAPVLGGKIRAPEPPAKADAPPSPSAVPLPLKQGRVKDRDGDGVPDAEDRCPDQAGPKENKGCPRRPPVKRGKIRMPRKPHNP